MKNKGQALVEFVLILPVVILLLFGAIDVARVINTNSELENKISDVVTLYQAKKDISELNTLLDNDILVDTNKEGSYTTITLEKKLKPITPGVINLSEKFFDVKVSRVVYDE